MARRRLDIWPAFVDLFTALFVAALGGFVLTAGMVGYTEEEIAKIRVVAKAEQIGEQIKTLIERDPTLRANVSRPGDEVAIDLYFNFETNSEELTAEDAVLVGEIGNVIKNALDQLPPLERDFMQVVVEGHTDSQQVFGITNERARYLFNWNLSALRAASVLYEFRQAGLRAENYAVMSIGYADTRPLGECRGPRSACDQLNRRTTIRLRPDYIRIEESFAGGEVNPVQQLMQAVEPAQ